MTVRDVDRLIVTREPVMIGREVYRVESLTITFTGGFVKYLVKLRDLEGRRFSTTLDNLCYLDGRSSI